MQIRPRIIVFSLMLAPALVLTGCTSTSKTAEKDTDDPTETVAAPLGSRIKRRSETNPVSQANRQQFEQERVQQGAIATGVVQSPGN
jgi:hypothetical protein